VAELSDPAADLVCASGDLPDGGVGVRFTVRRPGGGARAAFAIRYQGQVHAYLNRCAHKLTELDWEAGQFFDADGRYLVCTTHGALYEPDTGVCVAGPCRGARLERIAVCETPQGIRLDAADGIHLVHGHTR
jgi:nitrite reductase/ring-hydroxylating ferredoxin subunit